MSDKEAMSLLPDNKEVIEIVTRTIIEIPADNPSNPSIKLIALVIPTIQNHLGNIQILLYRFLHKQ